MRTRIGTFLTSAALLALASAALLLAGCATRAALAPPSAAPGLENGSFHAELDGFDIHYEVHGRGPVLMTVPNSWGLTWDGLRALYRPLEEHLTLVYFDPRGMGGSGPVREDSDMGVAAVRADFDALRRHLGLERVNAIGWSNGAMNLVLLALERPEILSSAIFLHGAASYTLQDRLEIASRRPELARRYVAFLQEMQASELPADEIDARVKRFDLEESLPLLFADPEAGRAKLAEMYAATGFSWAHTAYANVDVPSFDARDRLGEIATRSLVIAGAHDLTPPEKVELLHQGLADSRFVVFENSGHFSPVEEPQAFVAAVLEFLGAGEG